VGDALVLVGLAQQLEHGAAVRGKVEHAAGQLGPQEQRGDLDNIREAIRLHLAQLARVDQRPHVLALDAHLARQPDEAGGGVEAGRVRGAKI